MQTYVTTQTWGYNILSRQKVRFYHILLHQISLEFLCQQIVEISYIEKQDNNTIIIYTHLPNATEEVVKKLLALFQNKSLDFFDTPRFYYKIPQTLRQSLLSWGLAFEGCLALLLVADSDVKKHIKGQWEYINASTGGLYLSPFTLLLYQDYAKIVHPITLQNYEARKTVEQKTANTIRKMLKRIEQAQKGFEGVALLSMVTEKTYVSNNEITKRINAKSFQVKARVYSPFFAPF